MAKTVAPKSKDQLRAEREQAAMARKPAGSTGTVNDKGEYIPDPPGPSIYER
jgi:hypothetical protein